MLLSGFWRYLPQSGEQLLPWCEGFILGLVTFAFWHHSPPIRDQWVWLLGLALPVFAWRRWQSGRWAWLGPFWPWMIAFLLLTMLNYQLAPLRRADYWVVMSRPLLGIWLMIYLADLGQRGQLPIAGWLTLWGAFLLGLLAMVATNWNEKALLFAPLIEMFPVLNARAFLPDMLLRFNANEIAGALAWAVPWSFGLAISPALGRRARWLALGAMVLGGTALMLGQSRFAIAGVGVACLMLTCVLLRGWARWIVVGTLVGLAFMQAGLVLGIWSPVADEIALSSRDTQTLSQREALWASALSMAIDYPLTGIGLSMFRTAIQQPAYALPPDLAPRFPAPHAHNLWLNTLAEMGWPGLFILLGWQGTTAFIVLRTLRRADSITRTLVLGAAAGLLAHNLYGLGDAVPWWDRLAFIGWWWIGLILAAYNATPGSAANPDTPDPDQAQ